jgi:hypothetical protein
VSVAAEPVPFDQLEFVYELKKPVGLRPVLYILGGLVLLGLAGLAFLVGLLIPAENKAFVAFIASTVIPTMGAIAAFGAAFSLMRSPTRVVVAPKGLIVEGDRGTRRWMWSQIGWASRGTGAISFRPQLSVFDTAGKKLVVLGPEFKDFNALAESITDAIAKKPGDVAATVQGRNARKSAVFLILGGVAFLALGIANGINASREKSTAKQLASEGVETEATVKRHYLYNVTPRLEYEFDASNGRHIHRDAMMTKQGWTTLGDSPTVPVRYVPSDPDNNRLIAGEVENDMGSPDMNLLLSFAVGALATFFLAVGVMQWCGWDIDLDSKTGKVSIKRFGTGR